MIRLQLEREMEVAAGSRGGDESKPEGSASLFDDSGFSKTGFDGDGKPMPEHERAVFARLKHDEAIQLDELIESLEAELGSAEIFTALFELELAGKVKQLPGKNYVRSF